jgi:hypothetical protein
MKWRKSCGSTEPCDKPGAVQRGCGESGSAERGIPVAVPVESLLPGRICPPSVEC